MMDDRTKRNIFILGAVVGAAAALGGAVVLARKIAEKKEREAGQFSAADALCSLDDNGEEVWVNIPDQKRQNSADDPDFQETGTSAGVDEGVCADDEPAADTEQESV